MVPARRAHGSCLNGEFWPDGPNFLPGACGEQGLRGAPHRGKRRARGGPAPRSPNGLPGIAGSRAFGAPCPAPQRRRVPRRRWRAQTVEGRLRGPCRLSRRCPHVRSQHALQAFGRRRPCHVPEPPPRATSPRSAGRDRGLAWLACRSGVRARRRRAVRTWPRGGGRGGSVPGSRRASPARPWAGPFALEPALARARPAPTAFAPEPDCPGVPGRRCGLFASGGARGCGAYGVLSTLNSGMAFTRYSGSPLLV